MPASETRSGSIIRNAAKVGSFIHIWVTASPLPSFCGEPKCVEIPNNADEIDAFTDSVWESLNADNKVSLFVRYINIADGSI